MGRSSNKSDSHVSSCPNFINDLNNFYCRLDTVDGRIECDEFCKNLTAETSVVVSEDDVAASLFKLKPNKTTGPDGLKAQLKDCADAQCQNHANSIIRPVPNRTDTSTPNDFLPIAITSILCKPWNHGVLASHLNNTAATMLAPFQFAC